MDVEDTREWHLDRKFALGLIFSIIIQTFGIVWWAAVISKTVSDLALNDARHDGVISALSAGREANASRITALEAKGASIEAKLNRIEDKLDRLIESKAPR